MNPAVERSSLCGMDVVGVRFAHCEWQNPAERRIQEVKAAANALMDEANAQEELWYLACYHATQVLNILAKEGESTTPYEKCFGETPD